MPIYLEHFAIDWGWPQLSEAERVVVRQHEARAMADPGSHTRTTLEEALVRASRELPGRVIRAQAEEADEAFVLVARDGTCGAGDQATFDPEGAFPEILTAADYVAAGVDRIRVGLFWPRAMLDAMFDQARRLDHSLSWVVEQAWALAGTVRDDARDPAGPPRDGARVRQSVFLAVEVYAAITETAVREDRSMSWVVQRAVARAWRRLTALTPAG